jgi:hypothetical protein
VALNKILSGDFLGRACQALEMIKSSQEINLEKILKQVELFKSLMLSLPNQANLLSLEDLRIFFERYLSSKSLVEIELTEFKKALSAYVKSKPRKFSFYFRIGGFLYLGFSEGYRIGNGRLLPFDKLPRPIKKNISEGLKQSYRYEPNYGWTFKKFSRHFGRRWYMHITVKSIGSKRAEEIAILAARRNASIYKLVNEYEESIVLNSGCFRLLFLRALLWQG